MTAAPDTLEIPIETAVKAVLETSTSVQVRPRYEGNNICTWIGFKHVNYLVEEALLDHFRQAGLSSRRLFEQFGLGWDVVTLDTRILNAFHLDEVGVATVVPNGAVPGGLAFTITISKEGGRARDVAAKAVVALRRERYLQLDDATPPELAPYAVDHIGGSGPGDQVDALPATPLSAGRGTSASDDPVLAHLTADSNSFGWKWRIPYPYCHNNERMQMSGFLRQMEEVVDLFLADRGISIKTLLDDRRWIPVVPHSRVELLDEALMEEDLYTIYTVEEIFKDFTYRSRMDTYVVRDGRLVQISTGTITHGYAVIDNRRDWRLQPFDERVLAALRGR